MSYREDMDFASITAGAASADTRHDPTEPTVADTKRIDETARRLYPQVLGYMINKLRRKEDAEDCTQHVFLRFAKAYPRHYRDFPDDRLQAVIFGIAWRTVGEYRERRKKLLSIDVPYNGGDDTLGDHLEGDDLTPLIVWEKIPGQEKIHELEDPANFVELLRDDQLKRAFRSLKPISQHVLALVFLGFSIKELQLKLTGFMDALKQKNGDPHVVAEGTVKSWIKRARDEFNEAHAALTGEQSDVSSIFMLNKSGNQYGKSGENGMEAE